MSVKAIKDVVESHLCCGCGACAYMCPEAFEMRDEHHFGRRPAVNTDAAHDRDAQQALSVCPGAALEHDPAQLEAASLTELASAWGPVYGIWEGYAADPEVRYSGSSGGAVTALALYCLEKGGMHGVLHTKADGDIPYLNTTVMSRSRKDLLSATGSRYAPASPCEKLGMIEDAPASCVFVGKPCDVAATRRARKLRPELDRKMGVTIGFFCAGTPSTEGTLEMLRQMGIADPASLVSLRYRGNGWPGMTTAVFRNGVREETRDLTYQQSWGDVLSRYQQGRCKVCADHTGEFADISVGDPWYRDVEEGEAGQSLVLARTPLGEEIIQGAVDAGYLTLTRVEPSVLPASQPNLLRTRGAVWGRILALRLMGANAPRYNRMPLFRHWWRELTSAQKFNSVAGMFSRMLRRGRDSEHLDQVGKRQMLGKNRRG